MSSGSGQPGRQLGPEPRRRRVFLGTRRVTQPGGASPVDGYTLRGVLCGLRAKEIKKGRNQLA
jgi:hypothetical protein